MNPADFKRCGAGTSTCCALLVIEGRGFACALGEEQLETSIRAAVAATTMSARWLPTKPYPECQQERMDAAS